VKINEVWGRKPKQQIDPKNLASWADIAKDLPSREKSGSEFRKQFQIVDTDPVTIQWKNQHFQRKDGNGPWVNFPAGKPVSQQMSDALDKVSPQVEPERPVRAQKPISVTDQQGAVWNYSDSDRNWYSADNQQVTNPEDIKKLNRAAEVQFQNRQMGV
jgi:hypothetical protein